MNSLSILLAQSDVDDTLKFQQLYRFFDQISTPKLITGSLLSLFI